MKLNKSTDYALRLMVFLATNKQVYQMPFLSETLFIPYYPIVKIVQRLSRLGMIATKQGKHGGVFLVQDPSHITLKTIVHAFEGATQLTDCLADSQACQLSTKCQLKQVFTQIQSQFHSILDHYTISDIMDVQCGQSLKMNQLDVHYAK